MGYLGYELEADVEMLLIAAVVIIAAPTAATITAQIFQTAMPHIVAVNQNSPDESDLVIGLLLQ